MLILAGCLRDPEGILSDSLSALQGFLQHFSLEEVEDFGDFWGFLGIFRDF